MILSQGIVCNASLLAPLHVLDESKCVGEQVVALYQAAGRKAASTQLKLIQAFPSADAATFSVDCDLTAGGSVTFAEQAGEGGRLIVQWLTIERGTVGVQSIYSKIREIVRIDRYEYRSASGAIVSACNISAIFLDKKMPLGTSGVPVCHSDSGKIVGFVHGDAAQNDSFASVWIRNRCGLAFSFSMTAAKPKISFSLYSSAPNVDEYISVGVALVDTKAGKLCLQPRRLIMTSNRSRLRSGR